MEIRSYFVWIVSCNLVATGLLVRAAVELRAGRDHVAQCAFGRDV